MKFFPKEQFLILKSEDMFENPTLAIEKCCEFLEIPKFKFKIYPKCNKASSADVSQEIQQMLSDYFRPHNEKLEDYLGVEFNWN